jgi:dolichol-phosphate mannosyltransferase
MKVLIGVPCYRCEVQIKRVLSALVDPEFRALQSTIAVIDNRSPDETCNSVRQFMRSHADVSNISLFLNHENYGLGGSQKIAIRMAQEEGFDLLVIIHGDDQASVSDIRRLLDAFTEDPNLSAALGSRFMAGSILKGYQKSRIFGNVVLNWVFSIATGRRIRDLGSGLNAFRVRDLAQISTDQLSDGFSFNVDLLLEFLSLNKKIKFLPITWRESDQISNARNVHVALEMLKRLFLWRFKISRSTPSIFRITQKMEA